MNKSTNTNGATPQLMSMETLIGNDVKNLQGDDLGDVKNIMLDMHHGQVAYVVLAFGGLFGMGEKLFAVPWNALILDTKEKCFILDADKEKLKKAPGFENDSWPNMTDSAWSEKIHSFYGTKHYSDRPSIAQRH